MMDYNKKTIWILEDDQGCQFVYDQILQEEFSITYFDNIQKFKTFFKDEKRERPVMIIADLMLNDGNFLNFLTQGVHPSLGSEIPFIIVSSNDDIEALRLCFREGANDYITKPFKKNELLVKIETILKTRKTLTGSIKQNIQIDGKKVEGLTQKQIKLLELFLNNDNREVDRDQILDKVWGDTSVHPKTIDVHLYNLRRKLHPYGYMIKSEGQGRWILMPDRIDKKATHK